MPRPAAQVATYSRLSGFTWMLISDEAGRLEPVLDRTGRRRPGDAAAQQRLVGGEIGRQRADVHHIGDRQPPTRLQHAERLAEHLRLVRHQVDHAVGDDHVARPVGDRQMLEFAQPELDIARADARRIVARLGQHLVGHVDADHPALGSDLPGGEQAVEAGTAAEIDQHLTRSQSSDRLGIAAAQTEVRTLRDSLQFLIGVAHLA